MTRKLPSHVAYRLEARHAVKREAPVETEAAYRERINQEIEKGLRDLKSGNVVTREEHEAEMDRFMAEPQRRPK